MATSFKISKNRCCALLIGFLMPLAIKMGNLNLYLNELILFLFLSINVGGIVRALKQKEAIFLLWKWNFLVCFLTVFYGFFVGDPVLHAKATVQYTICFQVIIPVFYFITLYYHRDMLDGMFYSLFIAVYVVSLLLFFDYPIWKFIFNYNVTGGFFKRVGLTAVNDYGIIMYGCAILFIFFEHRPVRRLLALIMIGYLIIATGSRVAVLAFILTIFLANRWPRSNKYVKFLVFAFLIYLTYYVYEHLPGLQRLIGNGLSVGNRKLLIIDALAHLDMSPWGTGFLQYFNPRDNYPVHNFFLLVLVELGLGLGLVMNFMIFLLLYFCGYGGGFRAYVPLVMVVGILSTITHGYDKFIWYIPAIVLSLSYWRPKSKLGKQG